MKKLLFLICFAPTFLFGQAMPTFNLDFETVTDKESLPDKWFVWGTHKVSADFNDVQNGKSAMLVNSAKTGSNFGCGAYRIDAKYSGSSIELVGYMKTQDVTGHAGLLLRIDGSGGPIEFDNMQDQAIKGTNDWKKYSVKLKYPERKAKVINIGGIVVGEGKAWFDKKNLMKVQELKILL